MKRHGSMGRNSTASLRLAVVTALGFAGPAEAGEQVSFNGTLDGVVKVKSVEPPHVSVVVNASGTASGIGKFTIAMPHVVDRKTNDATGTLDFKSANGDKLSAKFTGKSTPSKTRGMLSIVETAIITGGTGRFAGASGSFTIKREFDTAKRTTSGSIQGVISTNVKCDKGELQ